MAALKLLKKENVLLAESGNMVHASTLLYTRQGSVLVAGFSGSAEGQADTHIVLQKKAVSSFVWQKKTVIHDGIPLPHWNPVLFQRLDGTILLFYRVGACIASWLTYCSFSYDDGETWSTGDILVPTDPIDRGPTRCKILRTSSNKLLAPSSSEKGTWTGFVDQSWDDAQTWHRSAGVIPAYFLNDQKADNYHKIQVSTQSFAGRGIIQPTLWQDACGIVHMYLRSSEGYLYYSKSDDEGESWRKAVPSKITNNNSGIDILSVKDDFLLLVCNPVSSNWGLRSPLSVLSSEDNGANWSKIFDLETAEGEYSYPAIISMGEQVLVSYTNNRQSIAIVQLELV